MSKLSWDRISRKEIYKSPYMTVWQDAVRLPNGVVIEDYDGADLSDGVLIVATDENGDAILFEEYKYAVNDTVLTFPAGGMDSGESPEKAAVRELLEETGYQGSEAVVLSKYYPYPSKIAHTSYVVRIKNAKKVSDIQRSETESIGEIQFLSPKALWEKVRNNEFNTSYVLAAIALAFPEND